MTRTARAPAPRPCWEQARYLFEGGTVAFNVREPLEYAPGHIVGDHLTSLGVLSRRPDELPHYRDTVVVCWAGRRRRVAAGLLRQAGLAPGESGRTPCRPRPAYRGVIR